MPIFVLLFCPGQFRPDAELEARRTASRCSPGVAWPAVARRRRAGCGGARVRPAAPVRGPWPGAGRLADRRRPASVLARRWQAGQAPWADSVGAGPRHAAGGLGLVLAHAGLGVTTIGITAVTAWQTNKVLAMSPGQSVSLARQDRHHDGRSARRRSQLRGRPGALRCRRRRSAARTLVSERRLYPASQTTTTEAGIARRRARQRLHLGRPTGTRTAASRCGCGTIRSSTGSGRARCIMAFGGAVSLADRSLRVGVVVAEAGPHPWWPSRCAVMKRLVFLAPVVLVRGADRGLRRRAGARPEPSCPRP